MGLTIQDLLSGDIVKPREAPQDNSHQALGSMLAFLSQGQNQQAASIPQQPNYAELYRVTPQERAAKLEAEQHAAAVEQMKTLIGTPGSPGNGIRTPYRTAQLPTKGSGLLGGGSLQEFAAKLATSPSPAYASAGVDMLAAKPTAPHYITMGVKGQPGYEVNARVDGDTATPIGDPRKSYVGTNIFTGDGMQKRPATPEEIKAWGLPPGEPATMDLKTGEVVGHPRATTEAQSKAYTHYAGLSTAIESLDRLMSTRNMNPISSTGNAKDYIGSVLSDTNMPGVKTLGKTLESDSYQLFSQAQEAAKINIIHALTGGGYTKDEKEDKANAYIPQWGESDATWAAKKAALEVELNAIGASSGRPELQAVPGQPKLDGTVESDGSKWMSGKRYKLVGDKWHEQRN